MLYLHHMLMLQQLAMDMQWFRLVLLNLELLAHVVGVAFYAVPATLTMGRVVLLHQDGLIIHIKQAS